MGLLSAGWFSEVPWLHVYVGFSLTVEAFEQYLNYRQLQRYSNSNSSSISSSINSSSISSSSSSSSGSGGRKPPAALSDRMTEADYEKLSAYNRDSMQLTIISSAVSAGVSLLSTIYFFCPFCWRLAATWGFKGDYSQPLMFMAIQKIVSECISTPFQLYSDFVVEEKHGFNKKTLFVFIKDKTLGFFLSAIIGAPILSAVTWLIKWGGPNFHYWLWGFSVFTSFLMIVLYPNLIAPLFNKFRVLKDQELRHKIDDLAARLKFPLREVYEMDGSTRSRHSNAYFYGFWRWKRIVLFDTLLHLPHEQIIAVLGHELGHWKKRHMPQRLSLAFLNLFVVFYLYTKVMNNDNMYSSFGFQKNEKAPIIGLMLLANILAPVNALMGLFSTVLSRTHEFQADAFACELGLGENLKNALMNIYKENKANVDPDPWYSWWHFSHPPLLERLAAIDAILKKTDNSSNSSSNRSGDIPQKQQEEEDRDMSSSLATAGHAASTDAPVERKSRAPTTTS